MTTWMIVEDEPGIYEMLLAMSNVLGNEGIAFVDGDEAIAWVDEVDSGSFEGELPELALIDIRLPTETTGPMVGARLRKSPKVGQIGVVLMTAFHLKDEVKQQYTEQAGADLFLTKPLPSIPEMQKQLAAVVAKRTAMAASQPVAPAAPATPPPSSATPAAPAKAPVAPSTTPAQPASTSDTPPTAPVLPPDVAPMPPAQPASTSDTPPAEQPAKPASRWKLF